MRSTPLFLLLLMLPCQGFAEDIQHCLAGQVAKQAGKLPDALADYRRCIDEGDLTPRNQSIAYNNIGNILLKQQRYLDAIDQFNHAIELTPDYSKPYNNRGVAYQHEGYYRAAVADYRKSIELNPDHLNAYNNLAWIKATCPIDEIRNGAEAVQLALHVNRANDRKDGDYLDTLAAAFAESGNFEAAVMYEKQALDLGGSGNLEEKRARLALFMANRPYRELRKGSTGI